MTKHPVQRAVKRVLDPAAAAVGLVALSPVYAAVAAAVVVESGRPVLFVSARAGKDGRPFRMLKFRTMVPDAIRVGQEQGLTEDPFGLVKDDPRITRVGRFLRRTSLDELPQLLNVLRGDLSLVGPRPWPVPMVVAQREAGLDYRDRVLAGLTGPAQVRKDSDLPVKGSDLDLEYVERLRTLSPARLLALDLGILADTVRLLARGEGLRF